VIDEQAVRLDHLLAMKDVEVEDLLALLGVVRA
jgi:hypothetical protein